MKDDGHSKLLLSSSRDKTVKIWDTLSGEVVQTLQGHTGVVTSLAVAIDDAGVTTITSGSRDKSVRLWDGVTPSGEC